MRSLYSSLLHLTPLLFSLRPTSDHLYESDDDSEDGAEEQQSPPHAAPPAVAAAAVESNGDSVALAPQNLKTVWEGDKFERGIGEGGKKFMKCLPLRQI